MSPWGYQGLGGLQESGSGLEWRILYPLYGSFWELGLDKNVNVSASILVAEDRCPVSLCFPLCKASSPPSPHASVRFRAVPWGNFDLERMRVTDLAAAQGPAVSLRPGLGCPCYLSTYGTPSSCHGLGTSKGAFLLSKTPSFSKPLIHLLIHFSLRLFMHSTSAVGD